MAFNGNLIEIYNPSSGSYDSMDFKYMYKESYKVVPNRRQDLDTTRNANGVLTRNVLEHMASTISFTTPPLWNEDVGSMMSFFRNRYIIEKEKKIKIKYYCPDLDDYKIGEFYIPDIEFPIIRVENSKIFYSSISMEFIEY